MEDLGYKGDVVVVRNLGEETGSRILDELHLVSEFGRRTVKRWNEFQQQRKSVMGKDWCFF